MSGPLARPRTRMPLCVSVELLCLPISLFVYLSLSLHVSACQSVCLPLSIPLSICGVVLADPELRARYRAFQAFCCGSKSVDPLPINLSCGSPLS